MSRLFTLSAAFVWFATLGACAFAQTAPVATTVAVLPVYQAAEPYILSAFGIVFSALLAWAISVFQRRTGIAVSAAAQATIQQAATNAAGRVLAGIEGDVSKVAIPVGSPAVAAEAQKVIAAIPDALDHFDITPAAISSLIAGKIGILQTSAAAATPTLKIGA